MKRFLVVAAVLILAGLTQIAPAQVRGIPPSATSLAPGRQFIPGPSVTSLGPHGWNNSPVLLGNHRSRTPFLGNSFAGRGNGVRHFRERNVWPVFVPLYAPYGMGVYPMIYGDPSAEYDSAYPVEPSSAYEPNPGARDFGLENPASPRTQAPAFQAQEQQESAKAEPAAVQSPSPLNSKVEPQPKTLLIFKDGHTLDVTNYVIQGQTLFNLGDSGPRRIPLSELDLDKTIAENDNRGVEFQLP